MSRVSGSSSKLVHSIQTNGTLLSEPWCDLIEKWEIQIGLSIDGPPEIHDRHRRYRSGKGSFAAAYRGLQLLQRRGIPFHVISVLTLASLTRPEEMFRFYQDAGIEHVCFNIEEKEGVHANSELVNSRCFGDVYQNFLNRFFELIASSGTAMTVREFDTCVRAIRGFGNGIENCQVEPFSIVSVDYKGNLSTFSPELLGAIHPAYATFTFGNILDDSFEAIASCVENSKLYCDIRAGVERCRLECEFYEVCGGGAPANKIFENQSADSTETVYCQSHQIAIRVVLEMLERVRRATPAPRGAVQ